MTSELRGSFREGLCPLIIGTTLVLLAAPLRADVTGTILGTVTDTTGAAIPAATLWLHNANTGFERKAVADGSGNYELLAVPAAEDYVIDVEAGGFRRTSQTGIKLLVNQQLRTDFQLQVGEMKETVTVQGEPVQVESNSTQLGDVIEDQKMTALPLNGRSYLDLLGLQAGVVPISNTLGNQPVIPVSGNLAGGQVSVNGQRENANAFMVNGGDVEEVGYNGASIVPTLDSIQEFRLLTNSFDAEFGHFSGAVVNVITKSGTNALHGTLFEFLRNDKLDARNFFDRDLTNPATGAEIPNSARGVFQRNQYGMAFGGPILKNRLFFYSDYQGTREARGNSSGNILVPSLEERGGNFSDVATTGYNPLSGSVRGDNNAAVGAMPSVLSQRLGYAVNSGEPYWNPACTTMQAALDGVCVFPNQVIPQAAWSSAAKGLLQYIPLPVGSNGGQPFFTTSALKKTLDDEKFAQRIDLLSKSFGDWAFYYHYDDATVVNPFGSSNIPGFASRIPSRAQNFNTSNTRVFGPTAVNELRLNYTRVAYPGGYPIGGLGKVSSFGFQEGGLGLLPANPINEGVPSISLTQLGESFGAQITDGNYQNNYQLSESFSKIIGAHTFKFGGTARYHQWNRRGGPAVNGQYAFFGSETGNSFADFLLGAPDQFIQSSRQFLDARSKAGAAYVEDNWRARPNFTVNIGLRWEFDQPWYDTQNKIQAFNPGQQSTVFPDAPTGWLFPGDKGIPKTLAPTKYDNFAPRLGLAWSPSSTSGILQKIFGGPGKTSIRAAAGIFYTTIDTTGQNFETGDAPFGYYYVSPSLVYLEEPFKSRTSGQNPGQRFPFVPPPLGGGNISFAPFLPIALSPSYEGNNVLPYAEDFNFTIQRELGKSTILTLGYVGTRGHHLFTMYEINPGNATKCLAIRQLFMAAGQAGSACGPFGADTIYSLNGQTFYGTRPYSVTSGRYVKQGELDFGDQPMSTTMANSDYNAFELTVNKRLGPVRFLGAYTWSKSLDNSSGYTEIVNFFNPKLSKSLSGFDMAHNFVISYSYDLPFTHPLSSHSGVLFKVLDGWELSGITRFTTGVPVTIQQSGDQSLCACDGQGLGSVNLPNWSGQPVTFSNPRNSANFQYFSTSEFSGMALGVPGNANRRFFHGPGLENFDVSLSKRTHFTERISMDFRAEFFNVFNHAQFNNPVGDFSSPNFGEITSARDPRIGQLALKVHF